MFIFAISGFINTVVSLFFGFFVYLKSKKEKANQLFFLTSIAVVIWSFGYGMWQISEIKTDALFWVRILTIGSVSIPIFLLHWILSFLRGIEKKQKIILIFGYLITFFFLSLSLSPLFVKDVEPILNFRWWPMAGPLYIFYIIFSYIGLGGYTFYFLFKNYKLASGVKRVQIKCIIIGILLSVISGATNFFLWYKVPIAPYGNFLVPFYIIILSYAIFKHHLSIASAKN